VEETASFNNMMKSKPPQNFRVGEYFAALFLVGILLALLALIILSNGISPLALLVIAIPSLIVLGLLIFTVHCCMRFFQAGGMLSRIAKSFLLALFSSAILLFFGYLIWTALWKSSPYIGP
jgi:hypothetical protein